MFHYLVTFKTSIQAYNSTPFFGQRRCDSRVQGMGALKLLKSMAHLIRFQSLYILPLTCALDTTSMSHVEVVHAQNEIATRVKKEGKNPAVLKLLGMPRNPTPTM